MDNILSNRKDGKNKLRNIQYFYRREVAFKNKLTYIIKNFPYMQKNKEKERMMGIVFAGCCLICSAGNDFIFKLFARRRRSRGVFAGLIGIVWFAVLCMMPQEWADGRATVWWGILSGFFSITANLLLIEAMGLQSAGICATIYRFNLLPVVFGAWILLGEKIGLLQGIGIAVAVVAVLCFLPSSEKTVRRRMRLARLGTGLVMMAALLRGAMGIAYKYAFQNGADRNGILLINALFWIAGGFVYALFRERCRLLPDRTMAGYGILSGFCVVGIVGFMAMALQAENAAVVLPIAQMSFPATFLLSVLFLHERIDRWKLSGVAFGILAVILLSLPG